MKQLTVTLLALACTLALAGCGKKDANDKDAGTPAAAEGTPTGLLGEAARSATEAARAANLPQPDASKPLSSYPELDSGEQLMFQYVAASRLPPDFGKLAEAYSRDYRQTSDNFRKHDLLQALQPQMEQKIQQAREEPYAWMGIDDAELGEYDFQRKGFPVGEFDGNRTRYFNDAYDYKLAWSNRDQLRFAPVADEAAARKLEAMRTNWNDKPRLKVYFLAQSADLNDQKLNALVTRVQLVSRNGQVLAEYSPDGSVPVKAEEPDQAAGGADAAADAAAAAAGGSR